VRESFAKISDNHFIYQANKHQQSMSWKPSIHMPKEACRMFLLLKEVKVERLQDITEESAIAEGVEKHNTLPGYKNYNLGDFNDNEYFRSPRDSFKSLIQKIHGEAIWQQNPWVWVLKYQVVMIKNMIVDINDLPDGMLGTNDDAALIAHSIHKFLNPNEK
jgi:hypothetical protein